MASLNRLRGTIGQGQGFPLPGAGVTPVVTYTLLAINTVVWLASALAGATSDSQALLNFGAMFGPLIADGQYWRLFTAIFLHIGILHLLLNSMALFIFGRLVERLLGHSRFLAIYLAAGLGGSSVSYLFNGIALAAGASGAIFGVLGALAAFFYVQRNVMGDMARRNLYSLLVLAAINLYFGMVFPGIDNWAHLGGFVTGALLGLLLAPRYEPVRDVFGFVTGMADKNSLGRQLPALAGAVVAIVALTWVATITLPDNAVSRTLAAERLYEQGRYEESLQELDVGRSLNPFEADVYYLRGKILAELGNVSEARINLRLAMRNATDRSTYEKAQLLLEETR